MRSWWGRGSNDSNTDWGWGSTASFATGSSLSRWAEPFLSWIWVESADIRPPGSWAAQAVFFSQNRILLFLWLSSLLIAPRQQPKTSFEWVPAYLLEGAEEKLTDLQVALCFFFPFLFLISNITSDLFQRWRGRGIQEWLGASTSHSTHYQCSRLRF